MSIEKSINSNLNELDFSLAPAGVEVNLSDGSAETAGIENVIGSAFDDRIVGDEGANVLSGGNGDDTMFGGDGDDTLIGNKGNDGMFAGEGDDLMVWNNGDGSDTMNGGQGYDTAQVNFDTDLVNDDLQNKDVAEFSVTDQGVQFARVEVNDQSVFGLFELKIVNTEVLETNFGGGDDTARIKDSILEEIKLDLDGGDGIDTLDFSEASAGVDVNLAGGTAGSAHVENFENVIGSAFDDRIVGDEGANVLSGGNGDDTMFGGDGDDTLIGNKGNDGMFAGEGDDLMVWNNGDGSDTMNGGQGYDTAQVNFDTDLVNDDLQNKDVAEFSVTDQGVQFARVEVNDQSVFGLFELKIVNTEVLETNFGGGDDTARIKDTVLEEIKLDLDGGDGIDTLDFSEASAGVDVNLAGGTAGSAHVENFENVIGSAFDDRIVGDEGNNVIRGGGGNDFLAGGGGADVFVFAEADVGVTVIADFDFELDSLLFVTDKNLTGTDIVDSLVQDGDDVTFEISDKQITIENALVESFSADDFVIA